MIKIRISSHDLMPAHIPNSPTYLSTYLISKTLAHIKLHLNFINKDHFCF